MSKKITLHPLKNDGTIDTSSNLYPKTVTSQLVDDKGGEEDDVLAIKNGKMTWSGDYVSRTDLEETNQIAIAANKAATGAEVAANGAITVANGKNRTYYSKTAPENPNEGDVWFQELDRQEGETSTRCKMKQWSTEANDWVDVGNKLVAQEVDTDYLNAFNITAKNLSVLDDDSNILLDANASTRTVTIGGFGVSHYSLDASSSSGNVHVGTDGISLGNGVFSVAPDGTLTATGLKINLTDAQKKELQGTKINSTKVEYASSDSGDTAPETGWQETVPTVEAGKYLWTRTTVEYSDDTPDSVSYSVSRQSTAGSTIKTVTTQWYKLSTSKTDSEAYESDSWSQDIKTPNSDTPYVWSKIGTQTTTDGRTGDITYTDPVLYQTLEGLVSILSANGIDIISYDDTAKKYQIKADRMSGAVSDSVTIAGFKVSPTAIDSTTSDGNVHVGTDGISLGDGVFQVSPDGTVKATGLKIDLTSAQKTELSGASSWSIFHDDSTEDPGSNPGTPTSDWANEGWYTTATSNSMWMSQKISKSITTGDWGTPTKIKGSDGTSIAMEANADACTDIGDGYIAENGHLMILTAISESGEKTFTDGGLIRGPQGDKGTSIVWKGSLAEAPADPSEGWAYYNSTEGVSYYYTGSEWAELSRNGTDGITVLSTTVDYAVGDDGNTHPETGWQEEVPSVETGKYLWTRTTVHYSDSSKDTSAYSVAYHAGDGMDKYTWIKYSAYADGTDMTDAPMEDTEYIGISYNQDKQAESTIKTDYVWSKFKGDQGVQGIQGPEGKTFYTWIKYANSATPASSDMYDEPTDSEGNAYTYIGMAYNKESQTESTKYSDYKWSSYIGKNGIDGEDGKDGTNGDTITSVTTQWYKLSTSSTNSEAYTSDSWSQNAKTPTSTTPYVWSKTGTQTTVNGTTGAISYTTPILAQTLDGMVSILSADGIDLISKSDDTYYFKADHITGAVSNKVTVGGFTVGTSAIYKDKATFKTTGDGVYIGTDGIRLGSNFYVDNTGKAVASDLTLTGYATSSDLNSVASTANTASTNASNAVSTANSASNTASAAQTTANNAASTASSAQTTANNAASTASTANSNASSALTKANSASETASSAYTLAQGKSKTTYASSAPSSPSTGDCWFDTSNNLLKQYNGSSWVDIGGELVASKVTASYINGKKITAYNIEVPNKFKADTDGGSVSIGGFTVTSNAIYNGPSSPSVGETSAGVYLGNSSILVTSGSPNYVYTTITESGIISVNGSFRSLLVQGKNSNAGYGYALSNALDNESSKVRLIFFGYINQASYTVSASDVGLTKILGLVVSNSVVDSTHTWPSAGYVNDDGTALQITRNGSDKVYFMAWGY